MITFLNSGRNPAWSDGLWGMLCALLIYVTVFVVLMMLFMIYLSVVHSHRFITFAVNCFLGVLD